MNLRSRSTPNPTSAASRATAPPTATPTATAKITKAKTKSTPKRKVSDTDFDSRTEADGSHRDENSGSADAAGTTATRSQRRRINVEVEVEVVVPTPSRSKPKQEPQPLSVPPPVPLVAQVINSSDAPEAANPIPDLLKRVANPTPAATGECTTIVARDTESTVIRSFLTHHLGPPPSGPTSPESTPITSSSLYICGSPGVGKTALVTQLVSAYPPTQATVIHVNCFSLRPPEAVYAKIVRLLRITLGLPDDKASSARKKEALGVKHIESLIREHVVEEKEEADVENALPSTPVKKRGRKASVVQQTSSRKQPPVILVLDELDALYPPSASTSGSTDFPAVLYSLFSLTHQLSPHLALIGIANALDLTARLLPHLTGPLAPLTLTFHSYSVPSLVQVLQSRFGKDKLKPAAAMFIARAVAKDSSDVRKALAIARDACARARRAGKVAVDVKEVHEVIKGMAAKAASVSASGGGAAGAATSSVSGVVVRVRAKPAHAKLALAALVSLVAPKVNGMEKDKLGVTPFAGQVDLGTYVGSSWSTDTPGATKTSSGVAGPPTCMQLYNTYCTLVAQFPSVPLKPVHEAEFGDLVAVLEHDRLLRLMRAPGATASAARQAAGSRSKRSTALGKDEVKGMRMAKVVLEADVGEVRRGLTTAAVGVLDDEVGSGEGGGRADLVGEYLREVLGVEAAE
ncbi:P-loop containing nucleoside triphosphate hydrolase protein [Catenaria anguillulae PL171]|uniref:p-loop containing nucleoside triphosphate hydrolase protein n=1 Tax=Catenaria anguillulae PL171 TaxID=765915 RepID=A0A1Y2HBQ7_9FUNG|nr:P-loop containing nucleoside triphosphate hydrolase protein [Catenaria anguillulae PL171]